MNNNELEAYFFCSSKHGKGYSWSRLTDSSFESCNGVKNDFIDKHMSISGMQFFVYKESSSYYIAIKSVPYPNNDYQDIIDVSLSKVYINLVLKISSDSLARQIAIYIITHYKEFSDLCYTCYNSDAEFDNIGYVVDGKFINQLITMAQKIKICNNIENTNVKMKKISTRETVGRLAGYSLAEGLNVACLTISENEYVERFIEKPIYLFEKMSIGRLIQTDTDNLKEYIEQFNKGKKKVTSKFFLICLILGIVIILLIASVVISLHDNNGSHKEAESKISQVQMISEDKIIGLDMWSHLYELTTYSSTNNKENWIYACVVDQSGVRYNKVIYAQKGDYYYRFQ